MALGIVSEEARRQGEKCKEYRKAMLLDYYSGGRLLLPPPKKVRRKTYRGNDAFGVLGVSPDASTKAIKQAYLQLAREYHPDINHFPDAQAHFIKINRAYDYIMKHGDLLKLQLKCEMVEVKAGYTEFLQVHKRAKVLAGIEIDPPTPRAEYIRSDELGQKMQKLSNYMMFRCPDCRWKDKCDRATGFGEVKDIHHEIQSKIIAKFFGMG